MHKDFAPTVKCKNRNLITTLLSFLFYILSQEKKELRTGTARRKAYWNVLCCKLNAKSIFRNKKKRNRRKARRRADMECVWEALRLRLITAVVWHNRSKRFHASSFGMKEKANAARRVGVAWRRWMDSKWRREKLKIKVKWEDFGWKFKSIFGFLEWKFESFNDFFYFKVTWHRFGMPEL
jgi:hypothetical protein